MKKILLVISFLLLFLSGCLWSGDENNNYQVQVNNNTDDIIFVYYNINNEQYDESIGDYHWTYTDITSIASGDSKVINVADEFYDADIRVEYKDMIKKYDIDPDFWGWDEIDINIADFL